MSMPAIKGDLPPTCPRYNETLVEFCPSILLFDHRPGRASLLRGALQFSNKELARQ